MDTDIFLYNKSTKFIKFKVVGLTAHPQFQECRFLVNKMHECFPLEFEKPEIIGLLNVDWDEYLTKNRRRHGKPYYLLHLPVAVYIDGEFIGSLTDLKTYIAKSYSIETNLNFQQIAEQELINYFLNIINTYKRKFVYLTIAIDEHVVGSMLFMLYNDLVPLTCENFLNRCTQVEEGYRGTSVHRIAKYSWIQCGGWNLKNSHMACENYAVPHNRRGVLSMCNEQRHKNNSTQFYITLEEADWMDYNYVAFGQLIQGAEILNLIEKTSTYYQKPLRKIEITRCGQFLLCPHPDEEYTKALNPPYESLFNEDLKPDDVDSVLSITGYKSGKYSLRTDLRPYMPFSRYSKMFDVYLKDLEQEQIEESYLYEEEESVHEILEFKQLPSVKVSSRFLVTEFPIIEDIEEINKKEEEKEAISLERKSLDETNKVLFNSKTFYFRGDHLIL